ncbi:hypothetical protein J2W42_001677 [Rhizobium tibeticum]|uniref:Uncharacterized protein n=1 Tax=Rhizobium tibeticum TaxID=501024 RepID=A0A1H8FZA8_9HYPH|nr:hypothetical protein [Rhizobium tibeticum]MDP9808835.1 hypothetical protein [Rhizobium tibeticum]SEH57520.1 hypothetical protein RTCCBAU85039_1211 [Rhizobium tibeticum]SEN36438.1 hypothetical protein SAMN05216228_100419 [Rhizobium tibeticum]
MKIGSSISSTYGLTNLFGQSGQRNKQQSSDAEMSVRQSGAALQPSSTPTSISSMMWALQSSGTVTMDGTEDPAKARHDAVVSEFTDLANKTPAERIRDQILQRLGLTEDDLKAMPPEEREAIEKQIADELKRQLTGDDDSKDKPSDDATISV